MQAKTIIWRKGGGGSNLVNNIILTQKLLFGLKKSRGAYYMLHIEFNKYLTLCGLTIKQHIYIHVSLLGVCEW